MFKWYKDYKEYKELNDFKLYKRMYLSLFNAVTDALEMMDDDLTAAKFRLMRGQIVCEKMYMYEKLGDTIKEKRAAANNASESEPTP